MYTAVIKRRHHLRRFKYTIVTYINIILLLSRLALSEHFFKILLWYYSNNIFYMIISIVEILVFYQNHNDVKQKIIKQSFDSCLLKHPKNR